MHTYPVVFAHGFSSVASVLRCRSFSRAVSVFTGVARQPHDKFVSLSPTIKTILYDRSPKPSSSGRAEKVSGDNTEHRRRRFHLRGLRRHPVVTSGTTGNCSSSASPSPSPPSSITSPRRPPQLQLQPSARLPDIRCTDARHSNTNYHHHRRRNQLRPSPLVCRRRLMPRPVFPVVRLPYDQPDRVARVLDTVRREFKASRRLQPATLVVAASSPVNEYRHDPLQQRLLGSAMTAGVQQQAREPEKISTEPPASTAVTATAMTTATVYVDQTVDQVTVGVRNCTLTPKAKPEILVTAGGAPMYLLNNKQHLKPSSTDSGPYLLVPPINITAEISRPPLTPQYTTAS